jgi:hypothetical protein
MIFPRNFRTAHVVQDYVSCGTLEATIPYLFIKENTPCTTININDITAQL